MDKQSTLPESMAFVHNTLWREDQVVLTFHSRTSLIATDGTNNGDSILRQLNLAEQLPKLNSFLQTNDIDGALSFFEREGTTRESSLSQQSSAMNEQRDTGFNPPPGIYLFDVSSGKIKLADEIVDTSVVGFFNFKSNQREEVPPSVTASDSEAGASTGISNAATNKQGSQISPIAKFVNLINGNLEKLNSDAQFQIPISAASPVWLSGATPSQTQGCPITPPLPVEDSCALWRIKFPQKLSPQGLESLTGKGVTVFILDALPEREAISEAAMKAGDDNQLLLDVNNNVTFNYSIKTPVISVHGSEPVTVGKDVYGHHSEMKMPDHGLFIAGIVRDIAPGAAIECIRVLDEYCVGDTNMLAQALHYIAGRMSKGGNLHQQPVVINMSLVIPTKKDALAHGLDPDLGGPDTNAYTAVLQQMQSLVGLDAIFVASAGNKGDLRGNSSAKRTAALYPAGFANPPYSIHGMIPVGAVNSKGEATSYSCYPGPHGVATYGGEVPTVSPASPPADHANVSVTVTDAVRGIYSAKVYPPKVDQAPEYAAPNDHAWAYWIGTSFATPIISAITARILERKLHGAPVANVRDAVLAVAGTSTTTWNRLDAASTEISSGSIDGPVILAKQKCRAVDEDEEEEEE